MPIDYNPKDASKTWPDGDYQGVLLTVKDGYSQNSGNPMQTWEVEVYNNEGKKQTIKEYVVIPSALFKVKQLAKALGKDAEFNAGKFQPEEHVGASFLVSLITEEQDGYDDKNRIARFKAAAPSGATAPARQPTAVGGGKSGNPYPMTTAVRERIAANPPTNPLSPVSEFKDDDIPF